MTLGEYLAILKVGDTVAVREGSIWTKYVSDYTITKLTNASIFCDTKRFNRKDGRRIGSDGKILTPEDAVPIRKAREHSRVITRAKVAADKLGNTVDQLNIIAMRKALDAAEAVLRERGEWTDAT